jgi:predicted transcriptional regulator
MEARESLLVRLPATLKMQIVEMARVQRRSTTKEVQVALEQYLASQQAQGEAPQPGAVPVIDCGTF